MRQVLKVGDLREVPALSSSSKKCGLRKVREESYSSWCIFLPNSQTAAMLTS
jgi:hypothetical protein